MGSGENQNEKKPTSGIPNHLARVHVDGEGNNCLLRAVLAGMDENPETSPWRLESITSGESVRQHVVDKILQTLNSEDEEKKEKRSYLSRLIFGHLKNYLLNVGPQSYQLKEWSDYIEDTESFGYVAESVKDNWDVVKTANPEAREVAFPLLEESICSEPGFASTKKYVETVLKREGDESLEVMGNILGVTFDRHLKVYWSTRHIDQTPNIFGPLTGRPVHIYYCALDALHNPQVLNHFDLLILSKSFSTDTLSHGTPIDTLASQLKKEPQSISRDAFQTTLNTVTRIQATMLIERLLQSFADVKNVQQKNAALNLLGCFEGIQFKESPLSFQDLHNVANRALKFFIFDKEEGVDTSDLIYTDVLKALFKINKASSELPWVLSGKYSAIPQQLGRLLYLREAAIDTKQIPLLISMIDAIQSIRTPVFLKELDTTNGSGNKVIFNLMFPQIIQQKEEAIKTLKEVVENINPDHLTLGQKLGFLKILQTYGKDEGYSKEVLRKIFMTSPVLWEEFVAHCPGQASQSDRLQILLDLVNEKSPNILKRIENILTPLNSEERSAMLSQLDEGQAKELLFLFLHSPDIDAYQKDIKRDVFIVDLLEAQLEKSPDLIDRDLFQQLILWKGRYPFHPNHPVMEKIFKDPITNLGLTSASIFQWLFYEKYSKDSEWSPKDTLTSVFEGLIKDKHTKEIFSFLHLIKDDSRQSAFKKLDLTGKKYLIDNKIHEVQDRLISNDLLQKLLLWKGRFFFHPDHVFTQALYRFPKKNLNLSTDAGASFKGTFANEKYKGRMSWPLLKAIIENNLKATTLDEKEVVSLIAKLDHAAIEACSKDVLPEDAVKLFAIFRPKFKKFENDFHSHPDDEVATSNFLITKDVLSAFVRYRFQDLQGFFQDKEAWADLIDWMFHKNYMPCQEDHIRWMLPKANISYEDKALILQKMKGKIPFSILHHELITTLDSDHTHMVLLLLEDLDTEIFDKYLRELKKINQEAWKKLLAMSLIQHEKKWRLIALQILHNEPLSVIDTVLNDTSLRDLFMEGITLSDPYQEDILHLMTEIIKKQGRELKIYQWEQVLDKFGTKLADKNVWEKTLKDAAEEKKFNLCCEILKIWSAGERADIIDRLGSQHSSDLMMHLLALEDDNSLHLQIVQNIFEAYPIEVEERIHNASEKVRQSFIKCLCNPCIARFENAIKITKIFGKDLTQEEWETLLKKFNGMFIFKYVEPCFEAFMKDGKVKLASFLAGHVRDFENSHTFKNLTSEDVQDLFQFSLIDGSQSTRLLSLFLNQRFKDIESVWGRPAVFQAWIQNLYQLELTSERWCTLLERFNRQLTFQQRQYVLSRLVKSGLLSDGILKIYLQNAFHDRDTGSVHVLLRFGHGPNTFLRRIGENDNETLNDLWVYLRGQIDTDSQNVVRTINSQYRAYLSSENQIQDQEHIRQSNRPTGRQSWAPNEGVMLVDADQYFNNFETLYGARAQAINEADFNLDIQRYQADLSSEDQKVFDEQIKRIGWRHVRLTLAYIHSASDEVERKRRFLVFYKSFGQLASNSNTVFDEKSMTVLKTKEMCRPTLALAVVMDYMGEPSAAFYVDKSREVSSGTDLDIIDINTITRNIFSNQFWLNKIWIQSKNPIEFQELIGNEVYKQIKTKTLDQHKSYVDLRIQKIAMWYTELFQNESALKKKSQISNYRSSFIKRYQTLSNVNIEVFCHDVETLIKKMIEENLLANDEEVIDTFYRELIDESIDPKKQTDWYISQSFRSAQSHREAFRKIYEAPEKEINVPQPIEAYEEQFIQEAIHDARKYLEKKKEGSPEEILKEKLKGVIELMGVDSEEEIKKIFDRLWPRVWALFHKEKDLQSPAPQISHLVENLANQQEEVNKPQGNQDSPEESKIRDINHLTMQFIQNDLLNNQELLKDLNYEELVEFIIVRTRTWVRKKKDPFYQPKINDLACEAADKYFLEKRKN